MNISARKSSASATRRKQMRAAVKKLQGYVGTYDKQLHYEDYLDKTYVDDMLYGLGLSMQQLIPSDFSGAGGYERFKQYLREHLAPISASQGDA